MTASLDQLPRLSSFDPGALGEGGLDPLGLGAIADRIANVLVPGVRARMSQPRFVTLSAVGAIACQTLHELTADEGKTTVDIAFEWIVVEALVRNPGNGRTAGLPGNQKAARAKQSGEHLSRRSYLNGPRVFGFTGVYRPFSRDCDVLTDNDLPGPNSERIVAAWEQDFGLNGYVSGIAGTPGGQLRAEIAATCKRTLEKAECAAPPTGQLLQKLAFYLAPREARTNEKRALRQLIADSRHETRTELARKLAADPPPERMLQKDLAKQLCADATVGTRRALRAAIDYENVATALDNTFRRFLNHAVQFGAAIDRTQALQTPLLAKLAPDIGDLARRAHASVAKLGDEFGHDAATSLQLFTARLTPDEFFEALLERHNNVQEAKGKLPWIDKIADEWIVRVPYRNQPGDLHDDVWVHPMRLTTLARFLAETI